MSSTIIDDRIFVQSFPTTEYRECGCVSCFPLSWHDACANWYYYHRISCDQHQYWTMLANYSRCLYDIVKQSNIIVSPVQIKEKFYVSLYLYELSIISYNFTYVCTLKFNSQSVGLLPIHMDSTILINDDNSILSSETFSLNEFRLKTVQHENIGIHSIYNYMPFAIDVHPIVKLDCMLSAPLPSFKRTLRFAEKQDAYVHYFHQMKDLMQNCTMHRRLIYQHRFWKRALIEERKQAQMHRSLEYEAYCLKTFITSRMFVILQRNQTFALLTRVKMKSTEAGQCETLYALF